ncbi:MAG: hypothetical protein HXS40_13765 [Theionarchaea archaeon]|nr:hypothetical protein [Theionarchaea archaeon]
MRWQLWTAQNDPDIFPVLTGRLFIVCSQGRLRGNAMRKKVQFLTEAGKKRMLLRHGVMYDKTTRNVLRVHNKNESWGHFLTKAVLFKLFRDTGKDVLLEAATAHGVLDVFVMDIDLAIEVLSHCHPQSVMGKQQIYSEFGEFLVVEVPHVCLDQFCQKVTEQVDIWL